MHELFDVLCTIMGSTRKSLITRDTIMKELRSRENVRKSWTIIYSLHSEENNNEGIITQRNSKK